MQPLYPVAGTPGRLRADSRLIFVGRAAVRAALAVAVMIGLGACEETPLNVAPIVDRSVPPGAAAAAVRAAGAAGPGPASATAADGGALYTVQKGDTLFHIAANAHVGMADLARWNGIDATAPIFVGQQLRLQAPVQAAAPAMPAPDDGATEAVATPLPMPMDGGVETRPLETHALAPQSAADPALTGAPPPGAAAGSNAVAGAAPAVPAADAAAAHGATWIWPVSGPVTVPFDPMHGKEIEIAVAEDAPVLAVADGTVSYTGTPREFGNLVVVRHGDDLLSVYAHAKTILVKEGQAVHQGQPLATAGKTPGSTTLHFGVRRNGSAVDPLGLLPPR